MFKVEAPLRMSTPGHSTCGADATGEAGWLTPGFAPEKKLATRAVQVGEFSSGEEDEITPETDEQPARRAPATSNSNSFPPRMRILAPSRQHTERCVPDHTSQTMAL